MKEPISVKVEDVSTLVNVLQQTILGPASPSDLVDTCDAVADLIDTLTDLPVRPPSLYKLLLRRSLCHVSIKEYKSGQSSHSTL